MNMVSKRFVLNKYIWQIEMQHSLTASNFSKRKYIIHVKFFESLLSLSNLSISSNSHYVDIIDYTYILSLNVNSVLKKAIF